MFSLLVFLVMSWTGLVFSLGHREDSKPGQGDSEDLKGSLRLVDSLQGVEVARVLCCTHYNLALSRAGTVYMW